MTQSPIPDEVRRAFSERDAPAVRELLKDSSLRSRIDEPLFGFDAPAIVAFANDPAMVEVLLEAGADPNRKSSWWAGGFHALYHATGAAADMLMAAGAIPDACGVAHLDRPDLLAQMLLENPARVHERGGDGQTPLHFARSRTVVDMLLDAGADIDAQDVDHRSTPAEWMLEKRRGAGRYHLAAYLVERGAATDIFMATALGLTDRVRTMLKELPGLFDLRTSQCDYGEQPPSSFHIYEWTIGNGRSPLDVALQFEQHETLDAMLAFATPVQRFVLACRQGDESGARALLQQHTGIPDAMSDAEHRAISDAAWSGDARAVALMLELGFDPRTPGHDSGTALHCAAWEGSAEAVAVLLRHADAHSLLHARDAHYGATPLGWCIHGSRYGNRTHDHAGVARLLLQAGALVEGDISEASATVRNVLSGGL